MSTDPRGVMILNGQKILIQTFAPAPLVPLQYILISDDKKLVPIFWQLIEKMFYRVFNVSIRRFEAELFNFSTLRTLRTPKKIYFFFIYLLEIHSVRHLYADSSKSGHKINLFLPKNTFFNLCRTHYFSKTACNGLFCSIIRILFHLQ